MKNNAEIRTVPALRPALSSYGPAGGSYGRQEVESGNDREEISPIKSRIEPLNLSQAASLPSHPLRPPTVPSPLPSDGRGEGQGEVRVRELHWMFDVRCSMFDVPRFIERARACGVSLLSAFFLPCRAAASERRRVPSAFSLRAFLLSAFFLLPSAFSVPAKDPFFTDVPVYQPSTNPLPAITTAATNTAATNLARAIAPGGTNSTASAATNAMDALDDKYHLAIGDVISFRIEEDEDDPKQLPVTDSGDLEVPYIGRFAAEGKTCKELAQALKVELEKEYYYQATVIIAVNEMTKSRGKVYLVGAVRAPGPQDIPSDEVFTLSKAVLRAGGFTDYGDKRHVKVTRKGTAAGAAEQTFTVDVGQILENGKMSTDPTLEAGDLIYIPERLVHF